MPYAEKTVVSPEKTRMEIEQVLRRYKADTFMYATEPGRAGVMFQIEKRRVQFVISIPPASEFKYGKSRAGYTTTLTEIQRDNAWAQEVRRRWRALYLVIKAKLESVESGIETLEEAFLAQLVLPSGDTFGQWATPQLAKVYAGGMPMLLPAPADAEIIDIGEART